MKRSSPTSIDNTSWLAHCACCVRFAASQSLARFIMATAAQRSSPLAMNCRVASQAPRVGPAPRVLQNVSRMQARAPRPPAVPQATAADVVRRAMKSPAWSFVFVVSSRSIRLTLRPPRSQQPNMQEMKSSTAALDYLAPPSNGKQRVGPFWLKTVSPILSLSLSLWMLEVGSRTYSGLSRTYSLTRCAWNMAVQSCLDLDGRR